MRRPRCSQFDSPPKSDNYTHKRARAYTHAHSFLLSHAPHTHTQLSAFSMLCVKKGRLPSVRHYF